MRSADTLGGPRWRQPRRGRGALLMLLLLALGYLLWPYFTLWRLDRALIRDDQAALAELVDLDAIRDEIRRKLNKEANGTIGPLSDEFITWLEQGIRRDGTAALEDRVNLAWVRERMLAQSPPGAGLAPALSWAFFDDPLHFSLRIGAASPAPVRVRLGFTGLRWRVQALYF
ncbi:MAG TPA: DUF2939 domain-containing protein [Lamprocystis sp. (in: g-proteobacteria)]|nr:DUF2939 domain-containing protein [Lamprocystis sp. (in: g-proteobacteria)]